MKARDGTIFLLAIAVVLCQAARMGSLDVSQANNVYKNGIIYRQKSKGSKRKVMLEGELRQ